MAFYPIQAQNYAQKFVKGMTFDRVALDALNYINQRMWMATPFSWTLGSTPPVNLSEDTADYTIDYPADWLWAETALLTDEGEIHKSNLDIVPMIPVDIGRSGDITSVAYLGSAGQSGGPVRVNPIPSHLNGDSKIIGLYKKTCPVITAANRYTVPLSIPDEWFYVFQAGVLWQAYLYADDRRSGEMSFSGKGTAYSGLYAEFENGLQQMRDSEYKLQKDGEIHNK